MRHATVVLLVLGIGFFAHRGGCSDEGRLKSKDSDSTQDSSAKVEDIPSLSDCRLVFLLTSDKTRVSVGESVVVREILYHPDTVRSLDYSHRILRTVLPTEKDRVRIVEKTIPKDVPLPSVDVQLAPSNPDLAAPPVGGYVDTFDVLRFVNWTQSGWNRNGAGDTIVPGFTTRSELIQFEKPGTYILESQWCITQDGKKKRLHAYHVIVVQKGRHCNKSGVDRTSHR